MENAECVEIHNILIAYFFLILRNLKSGDFLKGVLKVAILLEAS